MGTQKNYFKKTNTNTISPISMKRKKGKTTRYHYYIIHTRRLYKNEKLFRKENKKRKKTTQTDKEIMNYQKDLLLR